jgi:hypothetical protein
VNYHDRYLRVVGSSPAPNFSRKYSTVRRAIIGARGRPFLRVSRGPDEYRAASPRASPKPTQKSKRCPDRFGKINRPFFKTCLRFFRWIGTHSLNRKFAQCDTRSLQQVARSFVLSRAQEVLRLINCVTRSHMTALRTSATVLGEEDQQNVHRLELRSVDHRVTFAALNTS